MQLRLFIFDEGDEGLKVKRYIIPIIVVVALIALLIELFVVQSKLDGSSLESRELRLNKLSKLSDNAHIASEIKIDNYIISGYTCLNNEYGLAIFEPQNDGKYKFQTNYLRKNDEIIVGHTIVNQINYNLFWANEADLDYAEITYTAQGKAPKTVKLDATNNKILYYESPYKDYTVEVIFFDIHGNRYE